jgi:hypothetical protein
MSKELLIERISTFTLTPQLLQESVKTNNGRLIVEGVVQRADAKNGNGRVYPKDTLEREIQKYKDTYIKENRALGELDHPESPIINLKNVCHNILDLWWNGDDVMGKIEGLKKTNSKTPVPKFSPLREEVKKVYKANGSTYNANSHLGKIYEDLKHFNDINNDQKMRKEYEKQSVVHRVLHKREVQEARRLKEEDRRRIEQEV